MDYVSRVPEEAERIIGWHLVLPSAGLPLGAALYWIPAHETWVMGAPGLGRHQQPD